VVQLEDFVSTYQGIRRRRERGFHSATVPKRVKVAIIDTGINQNSFDPQKYKELNCEGEMFSETQDSHWWLSADSHGTQMAKLVTAIDPHCELYIAKVGDHKTDITGGAVSRVRQRLILTILILPISQFESGSRSKRGEVNKWKGESIGKRKLL
jgi:hypothetical protein